MNNTNKHLNIDKPYHVRGTDMPLHQSALMPNSATGTGLPHNEGALVPDSDTGSDLPHFNYPTFRDARRDFDIMQLAHPLTVELPPYENRIIAKKPKRIIDKIRGPFLNCNDTVESTEYCYEEDNIDIRYTINVVSGERVYTNVNDDVEELSLVQQQLNQSRKDEAADLKFQRLSNDTRMHDEVAGSLPFTRAMRDCDQLDDYKNLRMNAAATRLPAAHKLIDDQQSMIDDQQLEINILKRKLFKQTIDHSIPKSKKSSKCNGCGSHHNDDDKDCWFKKAKHPDYNDRNIPFVESEIGKLYCFGKEKIDHLRENFKLFRFQWLPWTNVEGLTKPPRMDAAAKGPLEKVVFTNTTTSHIQTLIPFNIRGISTGKKAGKGSPEICGETDNNDDIDVYCSNLNTINEETFNTTNYILETPISHINSIIPKFINFKETTELRNAKRRATYQKNKNELAALPQPPTELIERNEVRKARRRAAYQKKKNELDALVDTPSELLNISDINKLEVLRLQKEKRKETHLTNKEDDDELDRKNKKKTLNCDQYKGTSDNGKAIIVDKERNRRLSLSPEKIIEYRENHASAEKKHDDSRIAKKTADDKARGPTDIYTTEPLAEYLMPRNPESDIIAAILLFWLNCGLGEARLYIPPLDSSIAMSSPEWKTGDEIPLDCKSLCALIEKEKVTASDKKNIVKEFRERMDLALPCNNDVGLKLIACGCCGVQGYTTQPALEFPMMNNTLLDILQVKHSYLDEMNSKPIEFRAVYSIYPKPHPEFGFIKNSIIYYHLHPELVKCSNIENPMIFSVPICKYCAPSIMKQKIPSLSLANGIDFGDIRRIHLPDLSVIESILITKNRLFHNIIKFVANNKFNSKSAISGLRGHVIAFPHDAQHIMAERLPSISNLHTAIQIQFIGTDKQLEAMKATALKSKEMQVNPIKIYQHLNFLKHINARCNHLDIVTIDDLESIPQQLINDAVILSDDINIGLEKKTGVDVAHVRLHDDNKAEIVDDEAVVLDNILLTTLPDANNNANNLESIRMATNVPEPITVNMERNPINDFLQKKEFYLDSFPELFCLGIGVPDNMNVKFIKFLLRQFTGKFSQNMSFLFSAFNMHQRHIAASNVCARVNSNNESFQAFSAYVNSKEFKDNLTEGMAKPDGDKAKEIIKYMLPHIKLSGRAVPYSPAERSNAMTHMYSMVQRYGLPSVYLTICPDDIHAPLVLGMAIPPECRPDEVRGIANEFDDKDSMIPDIIKSCGDKYIKHFIDNSFLHKLGASNPVVCAEMFQILIDNVMTHLFGVIPEKQIKKNIPLNKRKKGIFGTSIASYAVLEVGGRKALHTHLLLWTKLNPTLITTCAEYPALVKKIADTLNSQFIAELNSVAHYEHVIRKFSPATYINYRPVIHRCPDYDINPNSPFQKHLQKTVLYVNVHRHSATCYKSEGGKYGCRFAKPSGISIATTLMQLIKNDSMKGDFFKLLESILMGHNPYNRDRNRYPLFELDVRCLYVDLQRNDIIMGNIFPDDPNRIDADKELMNNYTKWAKISAIVAKRNMAVVEYNEVLTATLGCNTDAVLLGSVEQAKSALFYLLKYLTKDAIALSNTLSVINSARSHVNTHVSKAPDHATEERQGKFFLQRVLNTLSSQVEISATQAAAALIGLSSSISTEIYWFIFIYPAIKFLENHQNLVDDESIDDENDDILNVNEKENDNDGEEDNIFGGPQDDDGELDEKLLDLFLGGGGGKFGSATVYTINEKQIPIDQHIHYFYRGKKLDAMSYYEWCSMITVILKDEDDETLYEDFDLDENDKPEENYDHINDDIAAEGENIDEEGEDTEHNGKKQKSKFGRKKNVTFDFDNRHIIAITHTQRLRSKFACPILAGQRPPKIPKEKNGIFNITSKHKQFAKYILTLFKPFDIDHMPFSNDSWTEFVEFTSNLEDINTERTRAIFRTIQNIANNLAVNNLNKRLQQSYRHRDATKWGDKKKDCITAFDDDDEEDDDGHIIITDNDKDVEMIAAEIQLKAGVTSQDQKNISLKKRDDYAMESLQSINGILGPISSIMNTTFPSTSNANNVLITSTKETLANIQKKIKSSDKLEEDNVHKNYYMHNVINETFDSFPSLTSDFSTNLQKIRANTLLNNEQRKVIEKLLPFLEDRSQNKCTVDPPNMFIFGGPGTGKSYVVQWIIKYARDLGIKILCSAWTGAAACNLPEGRTVSNLYGFSLMEGNQKKTLNKLTKQKKALLQQRFTDDVWIIIEDEFTTNTIQNLSHKDQRLRDIYSTEYNTCTKPFGGRCVIVLGDPFQLPPIKELVFYKHMVNKFLMNPENYPVDEALSIGCHLFIGFYIISFFQQQRAKDDIEHSDLITKLRNVSDIHPVTSDIVNNLKELCKDDLVADPSWKFAPIVVTNNYQRMVLNNSQARRFAKCNNIPVIIWPKILSGLFIENIDLDDLIIYKRDDPLLQEIFVQGADAYLSNNINAILGLVNGTKVVLHSITLSPDTEPYKVAQMYSKFSDCSGSDIIYLEIPPYSVNVTVLNANINAWSELTIVEGEVVIPLVLVEGKHVVVGPRGTSLGGEVSIKDHNYSLGFSISYHKVMGQTMTKLVADFNRTPFPPRLDLPSFYVGVSRVKKGDDFRIMPKLHKNANFKQSLTKLKSDYILSLWLQGLKNGSSGYWDPTKIQIVNEKKQKNKIGEVKEKEKTRSPNATKKKSDNHTPTKSTVNATTFNGEKFIKNIINETKIENITEENMPLTKLEKVKIFGNINNDFMSEINENNTQDTILPIIPNSLHSSNIYGYSENNKWEIEYSPLKSDIIIIKSLSEVDGVNYLLLSNEKRLYINFITSDSLSNNIKPDGTCGIRACYVSTIRSLIPIKESSLRNNIHDMPYSNQEFSDGIIEYLKSIITILKIEEDNMAEDNDNIFKAEHKDTLNIMESFLTFIRDGSPWPFFKRVNSLQVNQWFTDYMFYYVLKNNNINGISAHFHKNKSLPNNLGIYNLTHNSLRVTANKISPIEAIKIAEHSNYTGYSNNHFYFLPSSNRDHEMVRHCIKSIVTKIQLPEIKYGRNIVWNNYMTDKLQNDGRVMQFPFLKYEPSKQFKARYKNGIENITKSETNDNLTIGYDILRSWGLSLDFELIQVPGDGNCLLHATRFCLINQGIWNIQTALSVQDIRMLVVDKLREENTKYLHNNHGDELIQIFQVFEGSWDDYCTSMAKDGTYVDAIFITVLTSVLQVKIRIVQSRSYGNDETLEDGYLLLDDTNYDVNQMPTVTIGFHDVHQHYIAFALMT